MSDKNKKIILQEEDDYLESIKETNYDEEDEIRERKENEYYERTVSIMQKKLLEYIEKNSLTLCEYLTEKDIYNFLST